MHELSIAQNILEIVREHTPAGDSARVREINVKVGDLSGVVPDSLLFCFSAITSGTDLVASVLKIERVSALLRCDDCGKEGCADDGILLCPSCGSPRTHVLHGTELHVVSIELAEETV